MGRSCRVCNVNEARITGAAVCPACAETAGEELIAELERVSMKGRRLGSTPIEVWSEEHRKAWRAVREACS